MLLTNVIPINIIIKSYKRVLKTNQQMWKSKIKTIMKFYKTTERKKVVLDKSVLDRKIQYYNKLIY